MSESIQVVKINQKRTVSELELVDTVELGMMPFLIKVVWGSSHRVIVCVTTISRGVSLSYAAYDGVRVTSVVVMVHDADAAPSVAGSAVEHVVIFAARDVGSGNSDA